MKKLSFVLIGSMLLMSMSFGLLKVEGIYTGFASEETGIGAGIDFPLIPFFPTQLYISQQADTTITTPPFVYGGITFGGASQTFKTLAVELQMGLPLINILGVTTGFNVLVDVAYAEDVGGSIQAIPGNGYAGFWGKYTKNLLPLIDVFGQLGYLVKVLDGEKQLEEDTGVALDLSSLDKTGMFYRFGVSIGF